MSIESDKHEDFEKYYWKFHQKLTIETIFLKMFFYNYSSDNVWSEFSHRCRYLEFIGSKRYYDGARALFKSEFLLFSFENAPKSVWFESKKKATQYKR